MDIGGIGVITAIIGAIICIIGWIYILILDYFDINILKAHEIIISIGGLIMGIGGILVLYYFLKEII